MKSRQISQNKILHVDLIWTLELQQSRCIPLSVCQIAHKMSENVGAKLFFVCLAVVCRVNCNLTG